jgi:hypothetical protein
MFFRPVAPLRIDAEILAAVALLAAAAVIGLLTVDDYGITVDEWNADDYGLKSLAWYTSGFSDRSSFDDVEETLSYYGPWYHMLIAFVQSLGVAEHWTVRHAMTFLIGLAGVAALVPMARLAVGRWAGLTAAALCLTTGYLYGSLFYTPIDVPFLFAMTAATLAIVVMAGPVVPTWPATAAAGILTGLAIATRASGLITHAYLVGAMTLCAVEAITRDGDARGVLLRIGTRTLAAMAMAWLTAFATWPWLQIGNPFTQFKIAFALFAKHPASWEFMSWGRTVTTDNLPWTYVPEQLAARLPEGFLLLLALTFVLGLVHAFGVLGALYREKARRPLERIKAAMLMVAQSRQALVVWVAALLPVVFIMARNSTLYDGIRHVLFLIPAVAVIASYGFVRLLPLLGRFPVVAAIGIGGYAGYLLFALATLHPLQYIAFNALAGGVYGAYQRFDMDYWQVSAKVALRRLEQRLDHEQPARSKDNPPGLLMCVSYREHMVAPMYGRPWRLEYEADKADYIIAVERREDCAQKQPVVLIDEVKRFGRAFAWTYARQPQAGAAAAPH